MRELRATGNNDPGTNGGATGTDGAAVTPLVRLRFPCGPRVRGAAADAGKSVNRIGKRESKEGGSRTRATSHRRRRAGAPPRATPRTTRACEERPSPIRWEERAGASASRPGVISIGHQHPPRAASTFEEMTPIAAAWPSVRARLPRSSPTDAMRLRVRDHDDDHHGEVRTPVHLEENGSRDHRKGDLNRFRGRACRPTCRARRRAGSIGVYASLRRSPCRRSITRRIAPLVVITSSVNMTMIPGIACSKPARGRSSVCPPVSLRA